jgi:hypothetical protein
LKNNTPAEDKWLYEEPADKVDKENRIQQPRRPSRRRDTQLTYIEEDDIISSYHARKSHVLIEETTSHRGHGGLRRELASGEALSGQASDRGRLLAVRNTHATHGQAGEGMARPNRVQFNSTVTVQNLPPVNNSPPHRNHCSAEILTLIK